MALPLQYSFRNVIVRWRATLATVLGIALLVIVYLWMQALATGLDTAAALTGDPRNLMVVRKGSDSESASQILRSDLGIVQYADEIARNEKGEPLISADLLTMAYLPRRDGSGSGTNVTIRGVSRLGRELRPQVQLVQGRWFNGGNREAVVSRRLAARFANMELGGLIQITKARALKVVGLFDGNGSAFDSEIWMDVDEARALFSRENYSSLLLRPVDETAARKLVEQLEADKRLVVRVRREAEYYAEQTETSKPIRALGDLLAVAMSLGAVCAAMNTMYASVGARTREFGTLRVLGYRRRAVVMGIMLEGLCVALIGGVLGSMISLAFNGFEAGTLNFSTFSETVFQLRVTPAMMLQGCAFAAAVGLVGTLLPAIRAARMPVIDALKAV